MVYCKKACPHNKPEGKDCLIQLVRSVYPNCCSKFCMTLSKRSSLVYYQRRVVEYPAVLFKMSLIFCVKLGKKKLFPTLFLTKLILEILSLYTRVCVWFWNNFFICTKFNFNFLLLHVCTCKSPVFSSPYHHPKHTHTHTHEFACIQIYVIFLYISFSDNTFRSSYFALPFH